MNVLIVVLVFPSCPVEAIWDSEDLASPGWVRVEYVKKNYENFGLSYE
jgi:hypothetical protein